MFLVGTDYWNTFGDFVDKMVSMGLAAEQDKAIFKITDDLNEIVEAANKIGWPKISENFYDGFKEAKAIAERQAEQA